MLRSPWLVAGVLGGLAVVATVIASDAAVLLLRTAVTTAAAATLVAGIAVHRPRMPLAWALLAAGSASFALAAAIGVATDAGSPLEPVALALVTAGYVLLLGAAAVFAHRLNPSSRRDGLVEGAIVAVSVAAVLGAVLFSPQLAEVDLVNQAHLVLGPVTLAAIAGLITRFALAMPAHCAAGQLVVGATVLGLLGNLLRVEASAERAVVAGDVLAGGALAEGLVLASYVLLATAGAHRSMLMLAAPRLPPAPRRTGPRLIVLGIALLLPPAVLATDLTLQGRQIALAAAVLINLLVLLRLGQLLRERDRANRALAEEAAHDPLTGLPNRRGLLAGLEVALERCRRDGRSLAVLFCDLDRFKPINDRHGHAAGDAALAEVARRLRRVTRHEELVARMAGDEFVVVATGLTRSEAEALAGRLEDAVGEPISLPEGTVTLSMSVGLVHRERCDQASEDALSDLLGAADRAMYEVKHRVTAPPDPDRRRGDPAG